MTETVTRNQVANFLNTTPTAAATYNIIGDGVTSLSPNMNPKVLDEHYIHLASGTKIVTGYAPDAPVEMTAKFGDPVYDFVMTLRKTLAVGAAAETDMVEVFLYETEVAGAWPALQWGVAIQVDSGPGGEGGDGAKLGYTILYNGEPTPGMFDPETKAFTPDS